MQTGGCPHTAIREDASMNFDALDEITTRHPGLDIVFLESGGDNLAASFSPELVDASIYVIDVSGGDKIPRKGGPGVTRSDLLVINKTDLAPHVGADLDVMARDSKQMRGERPFVFTNLKTGAGLPDVVSWIRRELLVTRIGIGHCRSHRRSADFPCASRRVGRATRASSSSSSVAAAAPSWRTRMPSRRSASAASSRSTMRHT